MIPTCENMWGVLIFLRFYYIVGNAGIGIAMLIVILSFTNACLTAISLSAIASSGGSVGRGGPYYMISRSIGAYTGISVGFVYFLGIVLLAVLEILGAVETLHNEIQYSFPGSV
jgi:potassium/chloride transporter 4/5/6